MTQEDKEILLKDLCARLPYGVKLGFYASAIKQTHICTLLGLEPQEDEPVIAKTENGSFYMLAGNVKPYLFPLSSMTEEQKQEFLSVAGYEIREEDCGRHTETYYYDMVGHEHNFYPNCDAIDWLNAHHFDYRGLIEKGLALDATEKMVHKFKLIEK